MALSGLDIYKLLPKTNCKECGYATCLAFAMALAQKKASLDKCPHVTAAAKEALESASQPPIKLVTIGTGDTKLEMGNEAVMYRHEQKFYHPAGIGFLIEDTIEAGKIQERVAKINELKFERVGLTLKPDLVYIKNSSKDKNKFITAVGEIAPKTVLNIALESHDASIASAALKICKDRRPLLVCGDTASIDEFAALAKENNAPLAITAGAIEEAAQLVEKIKKGGVEEIVLNIRSENMWKTIQDATLIRRTALKKNFRPLGYPVMAFTASEDAYLELLEAAAYVAKYASIVIMKNIEKEFVFPLLVARQDIYTDPPKPTHPFQHATPEFPVPQQKGTVGKCMFCVHRTEDGQLPACVEACGMKALWIGDLVEDVATNGDETVRLSRLIKDNDAFRYKEELGTQPRVWYIAGHGQDLDY